MSVDLPGAAIPDADLQIRFEPSRGPGGQNVNKVSTAAVLCFSVRDSRALSEAQRRLAFQRLGSRLSQEGVLQLRSDVHRTQSANRREVLQRFARLLAAAIRPPRPRRRTRPTAASVQRRLSGKARRGDVKKLRRRKPQPDE